MSPLDQLAQALEGRIGRQILEAIRLIQLGINLQLIERLILQRQLEEIVRQIGWHHLQNVLAEVQRELVTAREAGWAEAAKELPKAIQRTFRVEISLGAHAQANPAALERLVRQDLSRIQNLTLESQQAVRDMLEAGLREGLNPREVAERLKQIVGMNRRQTEALGKFRTRLEAKATQEIAAKAAAGKGRVSTAREMRKASVHINRLVARKRAEYVADRAENIARTEVMQALNDGRRAQWDRLVAEGVISPGEWDQEWIIADDERTCVLCRPFDGQRAPIGGSFMSKEFRISRGPPEHPRCRCTIRLVLRGFRLGKSTPAQIRRGAA